MTEQLIQNVKVEHIEKIIKLIQDKFPVFNNGTYFLEEKFAVENDIGFTNLRDFLTHVLSIINTRDEKDIFYENQLALAEEHLRRAIVEPFEFGAHIQIDKAKKAWEFFSSNVVPITELKENENFNIIEDEKIRENFSRIYVLMRTGREKKTENVWNDDWEEGITKFVEAYELAVDLTNIIEANNNIYVKLNLHKKNRQYFWWAMIATFAFGVTGIILGILSLL